jgi:hypothetical protein
VGTPARRVQLWRRMLMLSLGNRVPCAFRGITLPCGGLARARARNALRSMGSGNSPPASVAHLWGFASPNAAFPNTTKWTNMEECRFRSYTSAPGVGKPRIHIR